jgi:hypothetical protein
MQPSCPSLPLFLLAPAEIINTRSRFLNARKSDPAKAHKQFAATEAWRRENRVLDLYATFDSDELESAKRFYPRWTGRRDKVSVDLCRVIHVHSIRRAYTAWNTRLRLSSSITDRVPSKRAQCSPRGPPLSTHVRLSDLPDHQRLMPTQCRPLGVHVPLYPSLLFRPPPSLPPSVLSAREFTYPPSTAYHFNDFDY